MIRIAVFLVDPRSLISHGISWVTKEPYSHAAIEIDGLWFDSSESRGHFGVLDPTDYKNRQCVIITLPDFDMDNWLGRMANTEYDWRGIAGWIIQGVKGKDNQYYCFEAVWSALVTMGIVSTLLHIERLSGGDIIKAVSQYLNKEWQLLDFLQT